MMCIFTVDVLPVDFDVVIGLGCTEVCDSLLRFFSQPTINIIKQKEELKVKLSTLYLLQMCIRGAEFADLTIERSFPEVCQELLRQSNIYARATAKKTFTTEQLGARIERWAEHKRARESNGANPHVSCVTKAT